MKKLITSYLLLASSMTMAAIDHHIFNVDNTGSTITITPSVNFEYTTVGIKITSSGFSINNSCEQCSSFSNGYCLFATSQKMPKSFDLSGEGTLTFEICANGSAQLNCQNYTVESFNPAPTQLYVANDGGNNISKCMVAQNGNLSNCSTAASMTVGFNGPSDIILNNGDNKAYVSEDSGNRIFNCDIASNGDFANCMVAATGFNSPDTMAFNNKARKIYVANENSNEISVCDLDNNGNITNCIIGAPNNGTFDRPSGLEINEAASKLYVANYLGDSISGCDIQSDGSLSNCSVLYQSISGVLNEPAGLKLNVSARKLYISNEEIDNLASCVVNSDGSLSNCAIEPATNNGSINGPNGLAFNASANKLYIANFSTANNNIASCDVNESGVLSNCQEAASSSQGFANPDGLALR